jgi:hypothetical protein
MHISILAIQFIMQFIQGCFLQSCFSRIQYCKLGPVRKYLLLTCSHFHEEFCNNIVSRGY